MKKVLVISTGGTIACVRTPNGLAPGLSGREILAFAGRAPELSLSYESIAAVDSTDINPDIWEKLTAATARAVRNYDGVLILHGTDTMEYTAALVSNLFSDTPVPVVFTGSMLPPGDPESDAPKNLRDALTLIAEGMAGVWLVFGGKCILGDRAVKLTTEDLVAFRSGDRKFAATFDENGLHPGPAPNALPRKKLALPERLSARVLFVKLTPDTDSGIFRYLTDQGYDGCVLSGFGAGGIPRKHIDALRQALRRGVIFVMNSQCVFGDIRFEKYLTGWEAESLGILSAEDMTDACALTRLLILLSLTKDIGRIREEY